MNKTIIIAEAGVNHNGDLDNAYKLVDVAVDAGVDYIKFQTFKADMLVSQNANKAQYQIQNEGKPEETQFQMLKRLELSVEQHEKIIQYCNAKGISFFSTAFDLQSLEYLSQLGLEMVKIPSGEMTNLPYLRKAARLFKKVILSTGMCTMQDIKSAFDVFSKEGYQKEDITILHCNTEYPTPMQDVNLMAMLEIKKEFHTNVGYSDHTLGIEIPIAAVALGATMIEKHITLNNHMEGPDHRASLEPEALKEMVRCIRNIELAVSGSGLKEPSPSEIKNMEVARKSIVASVEIRKGEILTEQNLTVKRPGIGMSPMEWDQVVGTAAWKDFTENEPISLS